MARFITINGRSYQAKRRANQGYPTLEVAMDPSQAAASIMFRFLPTRSCPADGAWQGSGFQTADASHNMDKAFDLIKYWANSWQ